MVKWNYKMVDVRERNKDVYTTMKRCSIVRWRIPSHKGVSQIDKSKEEIVFDDVCVYSMEFRNHKHTFQTLRFFQSYKEFDDFLTYICEHKAVRNSFENRNIRIEFKPSTQDWFVMNVDIKRTKEEIKKSK